MKNWFKTNTDSSPKDKKWWKPNISWLKLDKWVKRLDIYIIKKFLGTYFFAIALIISIAVVFDVNENIDRFINNKAPLKAIVFDYYMNFIPYFSNLFSPLFVFIAVIFFTSKLAENSEIIAMFSTGMSFKRMMRPYMISAAIISVVTFGLGAYVIPKGNVTRLDFEDRYKKKKKQEYVRNVQLEVDSGVIAYIERYENYNKTGYRFSLDKFDDKKLVAHLTARSVTYDTASVHKWTIKNYMIREMEGMREKITRGDRLDTIIKMEPQDFLIMKGQQQTMTSPELKEYIDKQKRRGFANIKEFEIEYYQRIAMSFAAFILTTIGVSLSSRKMKGGMGHIRLSDFGPIGYGKKGSFEGFASGGGIAQLSKMYVMEKLQTGQKVEWCTLQELDQLTARKVAEEAAKGDKLAQSIYETSAIYLGKGLSMVIDILNPEVIVIGGIYTRNKNMMEPIMQKIIDQEALSCANRVCKVKPAALGEQIGDYAALSVAANLTD